MLFVVLLLAVITPVFAQDSSWQITPEIWQQSEEKILRLPPSAFPELPGPITQDLLKQGCTIPQAHPGAYGYSNPRNVIRGEFVKRGQTDWAILCSRKKPSTAYDLYSQGSHHTIQRTWMSSVRAYFGGSTTDVSETGERYDMDDQVGLVESQEGHFVYRRLGYTRILRVVDEKYMRERNDPAAEYHPPARTGAEIAIPGDVPPPIDHQGIDDPIQEKASTVHYFYGGKWIELHGAD